MRLYGRPYSQQSLLPQQSLAVRILVIAQFQASCRIVVCLAATLLLAGGCQSPEAARGSANSSTPAKDSAKPNFGPPMQDVRTEVNLQSAEMEYNAAKNSRPTHQYEAEAEVARKAKAKEQEAAKETDKKDPAARQ